VGTLAFLLFAVAPRVVALEVALHGRGIVLFALLRVVSVWQRSRPLEVRMPRLDAICAVVLNVGKGFRKGTI
jgi:hypothetical protein